MRAIKAARKLIEADPDTRAARTLASLVLSLESEQGFDLTTLYTLGPAEFQLAIDILNDWRLDRYYIGKARLFDASWQLTQMSERPS